MKLIVGLGNPDKKYLETRHNYGFIVLDKLANKLGLSFSSKDKLSLKTETIINNERVILQKPMTYMNLSGKAVKDVYNFYKMSPEDLIVIHDDLDLPLGRLKLKIGGNSAGHNGIESIFSECNVSDFIRFKLGIGRPPVGVPGHVYVLMRFTEDEIPIVKKTVDYSVEALLYLLENDIKNTMNKFNTKISDEK